MNYAGKQYLFFLGETYKTKDEGAPAPLQEGGSRMEKGIDSRAMATGTSESCHGERSGSRRTSV